MPQEGGLRGCGRPGRHGSAGAGGYGFSGPYRAAHRFACGSGVVQVENPPEGRTNQDHQISPCSGRERLVTAFRSVPPVGRSLSNGPGYSGDNPDNLPKRDRFLNRVLGSAQDK